MRYSTAHLTPGRYDVHIDLARRIVAKQNTEHGWSGGLVAEYFANGGLFGAPAVVQEDGGPIMYADSCRLASSSL